MLGNLPKIVWLGRCKAWIQHRGLFHVAVSHDLSLASFTLYDFRRKREVSKLYLVLLSEGLLSDLLEDTQLANGRSRIRQRPPTHPRPRCRVFLFLPNHQTPALAQAPSQSLPGVRVRPLSVGDT